LNQDEGNSGRFKKRKSSKTTKPVTSKYDGVFSEQIVGKTPNLDENIRNVVIRVIVLFGIHQNIQFYTFKSF